MRIKSFISDNRSNSFSDFGNLESSGEFRILKNELKWRQCVIYFGLFLTNIIALFTLISLVILIYNLISLEDAIDINKQLNNINKISKASDSIISGNKQFLGNATTIMKKLNIIIDNVCRIEPKLCTNLQNFSFNI